jgi:hypothetical protein
MLLERELAALGFDVDGVATHEVAGQDFPRGRIFELGLDRALKRTRALHRIEADVANQHRALRATVSYSIARPLPSKFKRRTRRLPVTACFQMPRARSCRAGQYPSACQLLLRAIYHTPIAGHASTVARAGTASTRSHPLRMGILGCQNFLYRCIRGDALKERFQLCEAGQVELHVLGPAQHHKQVRVGN